MSGRIASKQPVPAALRSRLSGAVEVAPHDDFRIRGAGAQLGHLFRDELLQRLGARQAAKANKEAQA